MNETDKQSMLKDINMLLLMFMNEALTREEALTRTKLQEAKLWLQESIRG